MRRSSLAVLVALALAGCKEKQPVTHAPAAQPTAVEAARVEPPEAPDNVTWADVQRQFEALERERQGVMDLVQKRATKADR